MNTPSNLKYTKDHEWISVDGDIATVGITDFAQSELGDIVYVEVETLDETLNKDEVFGTVEAVKTVSDLFIPLSGEVIDLLDDDVVGIIAGLEELSSTTLKNSNVQVISRVGSGTSNIDEDFIKKKK